MKVTYEFDTSDENYDAYEHQRFIQSLDMLLAISHIQDMIRGWIKYESYPYINEQDEWWETYSEEQKEFYKKHKVPNIDRIVENIYGVIDAAGVQMDKMGY